MDEVRAAAPVTRSALLGAGEHGPADPGLRGLADAQSRWRTCLVPPRAQAVLARAYGDAYDAGFWFGGPGPEAPAYARALADYAYCKGVADAVTATC